MAHRQWDICNYLMDLGLSIPHTSATSEVSSTTSFSKPVLMESSQIPIIYKLDYQFIFPSMSPFDQRPRGEVIDTCRKFIGRFDGDHIAICSVLSGYKVSIDEFLSLRRSVWPDSRFYHPDFSLQRMLLAVGIACDHNNTWIAAPMCRSVLGLDNDTIPNNTHFHVQTDSGYTFFHGLAMKIGKGHGTETAGEWHALIRDVLRHLPDIRVLSQHGSRRELFGGTIITRWHSPLSLLISEGVRARMYPCPQHATIRSTNLAAALAGCEKSIFAWLTDLYEAGIDLNFYGENEKEHFRHRNGRHPSDGATYDYSSLTPYKIGPDNLRLYRRQVYFVRLINFHYGRLPTDWKFWWSEPSDEFAGGFWHLVESGNTEAIMSVPGAWVD